MAKRPVFLIYHKLDVDRAVLALDLWETQPQRILSMLGMDRGGMIVRDCREFLWSVGRLRTREPGWKDPFNLDERATVKRQRMVEHLQLQWSTQARSGPPANRQRSHLSRERPPPHSQPTPSGCRTRPLPNHRRRPDHRQHAIAHRSQPQRPPAEEAGADRPRGHWTQGTRAKCPDPWQRPLSRKAAGSNSPYRSD
jgi:hypothetical protein